MILLFPLVLALVLFRGANEFLDLRSVKRIKEIRGGNTRNRELVIGRMVAITIFEIFSQR